MVGPVAASCALAIPGRMRKVGILPPAPGAPRPRSDSAAVSPVRWRIMTAVRETGRVMFILEILAALLLLLLVFGLVVAGICLYMALPLSDLLNLTLRRIGLAGPSPSTRVVGNRVAAKAASRFRCRHHGAVAAGKVFVKGEIWDAVCALPLASEIRKGDDLEVVYNDDLTVTVVGSLEAGPLAGDAKRPGS